MSEVLDYILNECLEGLSEHEHKGVIIHTIEELIANEKITIKGEDDHINAYCIENSGRNDAFTYIAFIEWKCKTKGFKCAYVYYDDDEHKAYYATVGYIDNLINYGLSQLIQDACCVTMREFFPDNTLANYGLFYYYYNHKMKDEERFVGKDQYFDVFLWVLEDIFFFGYYKNLTLNAYCEEDCIPSFEEFKNGLKVVVANAISTMSSQCDELDLRNGDIWFPIPVSKEDYKKLYDNFIEKGLFHKLDFIDVYENYKKGNHAEYSGYTYRFDSTTPNDPKENMEERIAKFLASNDAKEIVRYTATTRIIQFDTKKGERIYIELDNEEDEYIMSDKENTFASGKLCINNIIKDLEKTVFSE